MNYKSPNARIVLTRREQSVPSTDLKANNLLISDEYIRTLPLRSQRRDNQPPLIGIPTQELEKAQKSANSFYLLADQLKVRYLIPWPSSWLLLIGRSASY